MNGSMTTPSRCMVYNIRLVLALVVLLSIAGIILLITLPFVAFISIIITALVVIPLGLVCLCRIGLSVENDNITCDINIIEHKSCQTEIVGVKKVDNVAYLPLPEAVFSADRINTEQILWLDGENMEKENIYWQLTLWHLFQGYIGIKTSLKLWSYGYIIILAFMLLKMITWGNKVNNISFKSLQILILFLLICFY